MVTLDQALAKARKDLATIFTGALDARLLLQHISGLSHEQIILRGDQALPDDQVQRFQHMVAQRLSNVPIDVLIGEKEFWSRKFIVSEHVLSPRPDTELLIETALTQFAHKPPRTILDLGTGTACLAITLLLEWVTSKATAIDIEPAALTVASKNIERHGVGDRIKLQQHDFQHPMPGQFDLIVSNPPYIATTENLPEEVVRHDPDRALYAGEDGLAAYRQILHWAPQAVAPGGKLLFEIGSKQKDAVAALMQQSFDEAGRQGALILGKDLADRDRLVGFVTEK